MFLNLLLGLSIEGKKKGFPQGPETLIFSLAGTTRLELATSGVTGRRSNQLNYAPGIISSKFKVQSSKFKVKASNPSKISKHLELLTLNQKTGRRNRARTCDPRLVRPMLSQLSYPPALVIVANRRPFVKGKKPPHRKGIG